jgi:hypothetical protein
MTGRSSGSSQLVRIGLDVIELFGGADLREELLLLGGQLALAAKLDHHWAHLIEGELEVRPKRERLDCGLVRHVVADVVIAAVDHRSAAVDVGHQSISVRERELTLVAAVGP